MERISTIAIQPGVFERQLTTDLRTGQVHFAFALYPSQKHIPRHPNAPSIETQQCTAIQIEDFEPRLQGYHILFETTVEEACRAFGGCKTEIERTGNPGALQIHTPLVNLISVTTAKDQIAQQIRTDGPLKAWTTRALAIAEDREFSALAIVQKLLFRIGQLFVVRERINIGIGSDRHENHLC
ncbi:hypothetical protein DYI23_00580 [Roseibium polysiphoniae]|uniref:Uncharacterized protein n=1 Tax=Roseibium polysiphoniae TaxID=2571221 RepID=A0A944GPF3_9HYPH|nr:hypothetical protein [Roseibium polysiphoniae]